MESRNTSITSTSVASIAMAAVLAALATSATGGQVIMVTVVDSVAIYDPETYTVQCFPRYDQPEPYCQKVARPDKPFPLPSRFITRVRLPDGSIESVDAVNLYRPGVHIQAELAD